MRAIPYRTTFHSEDEHSITIRAEAVIGGDTAVVLIPLPKPYLAPIIDEKLSEAFARMAAARRGAHNGTPNVGTP